MKRYVLLTVVLCITSLLNAQSDAFKAYAEFKESMFNEYNGFREKANRLYAEELKNSYGKYKALSAIPEPDDDLLPIMIDEEKLNEMNEDRVITIDEMLLWEKPLPQPLPISPIDEVPYPYGEENVPFEFYGTEASVRFNVSQGFSLETCDANCISAAWDRLSSCVYNNTLADCIAIRDTLQLCDWAYLNMLFAMAEACTRDKNSATMLAAYLYCQSGYQMRLGHDDNDELVLLYGSQHTIYDNSYFSFDGVMFYPFNAEGKELGVYDVSYPNETPMSLLLSKEQKLAVAMSEPRILASSRYPELIVSSCVNRNMIDFYASYPSSCINGNFMTRWAMYANAPMDASARASIYPAFAAALSDCNELEGVERLLNWVQTAFKYGYDDEVWGDDRAFFPEETLIYPFSDCEDRAILFSRLVRDLYDLDVALIFYPNHLATAVKFSCDVPGDCIMVGEERFVVCDPTNGSSPVGKTMIGKDNSEAIAIMLE